MLRSRLATLAPLALAAALLLPLVEVADRLVAGMGVYRPYEVRYLPEGRALKFLSPGARLSMANLYWMATVQYTGDQHMSRGRFERLYPLVDLVTDLDPPHGYAYQMAGLVLGSAGRLEESDKILRKGMERGPDWWSYPFYLAFNDYFYRGDYPAAARWARIAAGKPGASPNISHLALALEVKSGDPEAGLALVEELLKTATDDTVRERLLEQQRVARLQVDFARLDEAVARFRELQGRPPRRLEELAETGLVPVLPVEPYGGHYELRADGRVHSTGRDFRFKPAEPARGVPGQPRPATTAPEARR
jgi:tetratricopeptide (TPR) repeat protein